MKDNFKPHILLIDDDPSLLQRVTSILSDEYFCHAALTGEAGLLLWQQLCDLKPLVVCDVDLPDMSGFEICKRIKDESRETYVILLSNYNDNHSRMSGLKAFADQYLDKVTSDDELRLLIRNACRTVIETPESQVFNESTNTDGDFERQIKKHILAYYELPESARKHNDLSSKSIAEQLNMACRTFQREIKTTTSYSFQQLHLIVRLDKSRELFDKDFNVTQVADYLSFSSPAHLSRAFKIQFGLTPSKYRQTKLVQRHP